MSTSPPIVDRVAIRSLQCGQVRPFRGPEEPSAIAKQPVAGAVRVHLLGLEGDAQADLSVHGGPDKAIHHYPHDHYAFWREQLGDHPLLADYGAFGENIATEGLTEEAVCIGDRWRLGTALVEVRSPLRRRADQCGRGAFAPGGLVLPGDRGRRGDRRGYHGPCRAALA